MSFTKEPTVYVKFIEEVIRALIPMALLFGWIHWTNEQIGAVTLFVGVLVGGLSALLTRSQVVPTETANAQIKQAVKMPENTTVAEVVAATEKKEAGK